MKKSILVNLKIALKRKSFWYSFLGMLCISIGTYVYNLWTYMGQNLDNTPDEVSLYYLDYNYPFSVYILLLFPILLVLPYADIHTKDSVNHTNVLFLTKVKRLEWYYAQLVTVFLITCVTFLIPSILNIFLNCITFMENGNFSLMGAGASRYDPGYFGDVDGSIVFVSVLERGRWFKWIEYNSPQMYTLLYALLFSVAGGVIACFTYSFSLILDKGKHLVYFFPFVMLQVLKSLDAIMYSLPVYISTDWMVYLSSGQLKVGCAYSIFWTGMLLMMLVSIYLVRRKAKFDEI